MLHITCALKCEAKPLIEHFKLKYYKRSHGFNTYINKSRDISLTITGIGKLASATGTMNSVNLFDTKNSDAWINIGIAGHKDLAVGQIRLVDNISDQSSEQCWYPQFAFKTNIQFASLITVDIPSAIYQNKMFDMEASGFYAAAIRIGKAETIHCLKIISDNEQQSAGHINKSSVLALITGNIETIDTFCRQLIDLSD